MYATVISTVGNLVKDSASSEAKFKEQLNETWDVLRYAKGLELGK